MYTAHIFMDTVADLLVFIFIWCVTRFVVFEITENELFVFSNQPHNLTVLIVTITFHLRFSHLLPVFIALSLVKKPRKGEKTYTVKKCLLLAVMMMMMVVMLLYSANFFLNAQFQFPFFPTSKSKHAYFQVITFHYTHHQQLVKKSDNLT